MCMSSCTTAVTCSASPATEQGRAEMVRSLLVRGMLVGLAAALLALLVAWIFGESQVGRAIAFEEHRAALAGEPPEPELVSRSVQKTLGLATGIGVFGVALGGLFALAYA